MTDNYRAGFDYLSARFDEVNGYDFYRDIFPDNETAGELHTDFSHPNAIYLYRDERDAGTDRRLRRRIMLNDTWEQDYISFVEQNPMTLCSGLSYRRRANLLENAQRMHALVFDLDGVGLDELGTLFLRFDKDPSGLRTLPKPTYLVLSGSGLHVYYVFDEPVDLYPNIKLQMKQLKHNLTFYMWDWKGTTQRKDIQYQSINQGFRMVGSINERYGMEVKAFRVGDRVTLDYLNQYARDKNCRVDVNKRFSPSKMTKAEAKGNFPEWYQRVIVEGNKKSKKWGPHKGHRGDEIYNWWLRQASSVKVGHRYFFMMCLAIYASKCDVPKKRLKDDILDIFGILQESSTQGNELTKADMKAALEAYSKEYYNFTIDDIEHLTDIRIDRNKRNGRKQTEHLKRARAVQEIDYPDGSWRGSRPSARQRVEDYRQQNPDAKPKDCISMTGLSKNTVYKWWDTGQNILEIKALKEVYGIEVAQPIQPGSNPI